MHCAGHARSQSEHAVQAPLVKDKRNNENFESAPSTAPTGQNVLHQSRPRHNARSTTTASIPTATPVAAAAEGTTVTGLVHPRYATRLLAHPATGRTVLAMMRPKSENGSRNPSTAALPATTKATVATTTATRNQVCPRR